MNKRFWWIGLIAFLAGPLRQPLESQMALHMLIQLPLLGVAGWQLWPLLRARAEPILVQWDRYGIAALLLAMFTLMVWMIPRVLEASLSEPLIELAKFASMTVLVGMAIGYSWTRLSAIIRGIVWSNLIAMAMVMSWLLITAPVRVCNNYGMEQQQLAGYGFLALSLVISFWLVATAFYGRSCPSYNNDNE